MDPNLILNRLVRLAQLDTSPFDEVRDDQRELMPAIAIVAISALLAGIGSWLWLAFKGPLPSGTGISVDFTNVLINVLLLGTLMTVALWAVWVGVTAVVLQSVFKEPVDMMSLFRTMGYASFPFALSFLALLPFLHTGVALLSLVGWFVLSIFAVQAASGADSGKVIKATLAGFFVFAVLLGMFARGAGIGTGIFIDSESRAIYEGELYK
ncbi:MAG: YIP1 family protein [Dehalococcoidia bacterium]|nr:hypothetical protein [Dehalococcoidia bacterium]MCB9485105.1 hypothetical protein [Thermoflexaceae bacterium]